MNILFLTTHVNAGGITSYLQTLAGGLVKRGHSVWLVSSGGERAVEFESLGVKVVTLDIKTKSEANPKIYMALTVLKELIQTHDIRLVHAHTRVTQVMAALLKRMTGRPNVTTCHGFFKTRWNRRLFPCWGVRTIAISQPVAAHLIDDFHWPREKVALIPNGIDLERFYVVPEDERASLRACARIDGDPVIGIIARLSDVKGIDILIQAMPAVRTQFPGVQLVIMGQGKEEPALKELTVQLKLEDTVRFIAEVEDMARSLNMFDLFVMPSRQEGLGLSVLEAQACGLCVVASRVGGLVSVIDEEKTGFLVEPENIPQLADMIVRLLSDDFLRRRAGQLARLHVQQHYSAETMVEKTLNVYREVVC